MSEHQHHNPGRLLSPSHFALFLLALALVLAAIYLFTTDLTPKSNELQNQVAQQPVPTATSTIIPPGTIFAVNSNPAPTAYIPGPTAQFDQILPIEDWLEYVDEDAGFRILYPPDWYTTTTAPEARVNGWFTQFLSYDQYDPELSLLGKQGPIPSSIVKLEIAENNLDFIGRPFLPNESLTDWVHRNRPKTSESHELLEERETTLGGKEALFQASKHHGRLSHFYYIHRGDGMVFVAYYPREMGSMSTRVLEMMIASLEFLE